LTWGIGKGFNYGKEISSRVRHTKTFIHQAYTQHTNYDLMSDPKDQKPMKKTSAVPLRKETVRVTLKATPEAGKAPAPAPPAPSAAPSAPSAPSAPPAPGAAKPPAPAPTIPLKTPGAGAAKPPTPAPTVPLQAGGAGTKPAIPAPAPTVKLNTPSSGPGTVALTTGPATVPLTGGSGSQPLPKATVQLQQTQPMGTPATPSQAATIRTADDDDVDSNKGEGAAAGLAVVALVVALIVLGVQLGTANIWVNDESKPGAPGWGRLFE